MKPLVLSFLSVLLCARGLLQAQTISPTDGGKTIEDLKKKYANGGQKPSAPSAVPAAQASAPQDGGMSIADLEALLLKSPECRKNPDDAAQLAADRKGKYGIISCRDAVDGWRQIVLVPKGDARDQQLVYSSVDGHKLLRARLVDHYVVLQYDTQVQYLDMDGAYQLEGLVADQTFSRFEDMVIFKDALKNYGGVKEDSELLVKVSALTMKAVGNKQFRIEASRIKDSWAVVVYSEGSVFQVWPEKKKP